MTFLAWFGNVYSFLLQIGTNQPIEHPEYRSGGVQVGLASATYPKGLDTLLEPVLSVRLYVWPYWNLY